MNISVITVFDQLYQPFLQTSLMHRAQERGTVKVDVSTFFSFVAPKERIDAPTFGPGAGMLIKPEVVQRAIESKEQLYGKAFKVFFSPQGEKLTQPLLKKLVTQVQQTNHLMLIPARYEGMDARVEEKYADLTISVGDFVLMGGDLPAMMVMEAFCRLLPGVVGKEESVEAESFSGPFVDYPEYTEPVEWQGMKVPDIVRSGNHGAIKLWREEQAAKKTVGNHFGWLRSQSLTEDQKVVCRRFIPHHYVTLLHDEVLIGPESKKGTTSVTSIDLHDIARASATYDIQAFFIVTPLKDQQHLVQTLLDFWSTGSGMEYNPSRHHAVKRVSLQPSLDQTVQAITEREGKKPILIATSARWVGGEKQITYFDQAKVWAADRPVLIILGTGRGLAPEVINRVDYVLNPLHGFSEFNHLSVRSAAAIILDRWLGINEKGIKRLAE